MKDTREDFLKELYEGLRKITASEFASVTYPEFRTRMQEQDTNSIRNQVLMIRKILQTK